jgi:hypothetical protein
MDEYIQQEKEYLALRADYQELCSLCGFASEAASEMWEAVKEARDKLLAMNDQILNQRINYHEDSEGDWDE